MADEVLGSGRRVKWHRTPLDRETLTRLNARSDAEGFKQSLGYLGLLAVSGGAVMYSADQGWILPTIALLFVYGTFASFAINAVHELVHRSVFKTQLLNEVFVRIFAFLGWINFEHFHSSHVRHHQYTLHPPDDLEVVLPIHLLVKQFFQSAFASPLGVRWVLKNTWRMANGRWEGDWEHKLFPADDPSKGQPAIIWARILLVGHAVVLVTAIALKLWMLPVLISLGPFYGGWLFWLCNNTQHIGLQDNVSDFRLCCRTFTVNPVVQFLYWHMNYHIEHHMYAAVPCYNLAKLHAAIKYELPPCPDGIIATWLEIAEIQRKQVQDPTYQFVAPLPG